MNLLQILFLLSWSVFSSGLQCMSPEGKPVDWYALYKLPELRHNKSNPILHEGLGVFYMDVDNPAWVLSKGPVNDTHAALFQTLNPIYSNGGEGMLYLLYNDQPPPHQESLAHGHTKGVVAFTEKLGFWLVQSTPHFPPPIKDGFSYPSSGMDCGQSFLCVSYPYASLKDISQQLYFNYPKVYDSSVPQQFQDDFPLLMKILDDEHPTQEPWTSLRMLTSLGGNQFQSFAKYKKFDADLYTDFVAPTLDTSLLVESWQNGPEKLPSNCSLTLKVYNVQKITLPDGIDFHETKDHSKWAVAFSNNGGKDWVCIGDINRQGHQFDRAGGTVCFKNAAVWTAYRNSVLQYEKCPEEREEL